MVKKEETAIVPQRTDLMTIIDQEDEGAYTFIAPRVSLVSQAQAFKNNLTGEMSPEIVGIIIASRTVRAFWATQQGGSPVCASTDGKTGIALESDTFRDVLPADTDINPYEPMTCKLCPFNQWDSGRGGKGKACKEMRRLLIIPETSDVPLVLSLPPTSLMNFNLYASAQRTLKERYYTVTTKIKAEKAENENKIVYSKVVFERVAPLEDTKLAQVITLRNEFEAIIRQTVEVEDYGATD